MVSTYHVKGFKHSWAEYEITDQMLREHYMKEVHGKL
jgi:hypothetical protein